MWNTIVFGNIWNTYVVPIIENHLNDRKRTYKLDSNYGMRTTSNKYCTLHIEYWFDVSSIEYIFFTFSNKFKSPIADKRRGRPPQDVTKILVIWSLINKIKKSRDFNLVTKIEKISQKRLDLETQRKKRKVCKNVKKIKIPNFYVGQIKP